ncbi:putative ribonuclease H-like domain-containing protein [Tanacetum coccineum]
MSTRATAEEKTKKKNDVKARGLEQIHEDDLEAMDLKWQLSLLSVRAKSISEDRGGGGKRCRVKGGPHIKKAIEDQFRIQDQHRKARNKRRHSKAKLAIDGVDKKRIAFDFKIDKFDKASKDLDQLLESQIIDKSKKGLGYSVVPPPHPLIYNRPNKIDLSYSGLDEFKEPEFKGYGPVTRISGQKVSFVEGCRSNTNKNVSEVEPKKVRKNNDAPIIEDWVSNDEEQDESMTKPEKKTIIPSAAKKEKLIKRSVSDASRQMTGNIAYLSDFKQFDRGYVAFRGGAYGCKISSKGLTDGCCTKRSMSFLQDNECPYLVSNFKLPDENRYFLNVPRKDMYSFDMKNIVPPPRSFGPCLVEKGLHYMKSMFGIEDLSHINFKNINKLVKENLVRGLPTKHFENDQNCVACFKRKQHRASCKSEVLTPVTKPLFMLHMDLFGPTFMRGFKPALSFMRPFGCHVTILNTLHSLGKFDDKSDEGTVSNVSAENVDNGKPKTADDAQKQDEDGLNYENAEQESSLELNVVGPSVSTASPNEEDSTEEEPEVDLGNITNSYTVPTTPNTRIHKDHPIKNVIGDVKSSVQTRRMTKPTSEQGFLSAVYEQKTHDTLNTCLYACFLSQIEPTSIAKALSDSSWVEAMQEELLQFKLQQVWILVDLPIGKRAIGTKWVFRNKKDERGIVIRNKASFLVYQMDVKSAFLYVTIKEEVYVTQPPGLKDPDNPDKVYKVVKALYGLHKAPRAWYETLANYLLGNGFKRGKIDQALFIKKQKGDILLVQVYVDDIIFGSTNKELCTGFEKLMKDKFQMSSMGELTFFLGLQVQQKKDGIFISEIASSLSSC